MYTHIGNLPVGTCFRRDYDASYNSEYHSRYFKIVDIGFYKVYIPSRGYEGGPYKVEAYMLGNADHITIIPEPVFLTIPECYA